MAEEDFSKQGMRLRFSLASDMRRVAAFLLSEQRCEMTGVLGMTDTALLEEMLHYFINTDCWAAATAGPEIMVSPDTRHASMHLPWNGQLCFYSNVTSVNPTDDFTVRVSKHPMAPFQELWCIGFITRAQFRPEGFLAEPEIDGVYVLMPCAGILHGSGKGGLYDPAYSSELNFEQCMVRCVADRARGAISFHINGVDFGVAWTNVSPDPLYAVVLDLAPGVDVEWV